jgi:hypothetical protein
LTNSVGCFRQRVSSICTFHKHKRELTETGNPRIVAAEITVKLVERINQSLKSVTNTAFGGCLSEVIFHLNNRYFSC